MRGGGAASIEVRGGFDITIRDNRVLPSDQVNEWSAITVQAEGVRIERNYIQVIEAKEEYNALGGIWLRGGCVDIDVVDNEIIGGVAHGVMLGHVEQAGGTGPIYALTYVKGLRPGFIYNKYLPTDCVGCGPGTTVVPPPSSTRTDVGRRRRAAHDPDPQQLDQRHGDVGVGVFGFFANATQGIITVEDLEIIGNEIFANVSRNLAAVGPDMVELSGTARCRSRTW